MSTEVEAPPSSTEQDGPAQAPAQTGNEAAVPEVDFDRVLAGDEAYTAEINAKLNGDAPAADPPPAEAAKDEKAAPPAPAAEEDDNTITFRGKQVPIPEDRKKQKALMQKGMSLDTRLNELAPLIALEREAPDLAVLARTPEGRKQILDRIRQQEKAQGSGDLPDVPGYDQADVQAVDTILQARMKALGIVPISQDGKPTPEQVEAIKADHADMANKTRITLESLRSVDPHYEQNMALLMEVVQEAERTVPPEKFRQFYEVINDPRKIDPATGRPAFLNFYAEVARERQRRESLNNPAATEIPVITRKSPPASSGRLAPGAATAPSAGSSTTDWSKLPNDKFNQAFEEVLARG